MSDNKTHYNKKNQNLKAFPKDCTSKSSDLVSIDLSNNEISVLPKDMACFKKLTHFRMMANKISSLPPSFASVMTLRHLDLNANDFSEFPTQISALTNLEELQMIQNKLKSIPACIGNLSKLQRISFTANFLKSLPKELNKCQNLNYIELTSNEFEKFPEVICELPKVTILMLQQNHLTEVPDSISKLEKLSGMYLSSNDFGKFPESICRVPSLTQLEIDNNNFVEIPDNLSLLSKLKTLVLNKSFITYLNSIDSMSSLCQIVMNDTKCEFLPDLSNNTKLTSLNVQAGNLREVKSLPPNCSCRFTGNKIESIEFPENGVIQYAILSKNNLSASPDLSMVSKITRLDISQNQISWFDEKTCHSTLQQLDVSCNPIVEFPMCLSKCQNLKTLNMSDCHLFDVPKDVFNQFENLENLFLGCNHFGSLEGLPNLGKLKSLYLQSNNFLHIPRSIFSIPSLRTLFLSNNQIRVIPNQITKLTNLELLDLSCNQIIDLSPIIPMQSLKEIDLSYNFIKVIPNEVTNLSKLSAFNLVGNQLSTKAKIPTLEKNLEFYQIQQYVSGKTKEEPKEDTTIMACNIFGDKKVFKQFSIPFDPNPIISLRRPDCFLNRENTPIEFGLVEMRGRRPTMQDTSFFISNYLFKDFYFAGLFDGHGGDVVSKISSGSYPTIFADKLMNQIKKQVGKKRIDAENFFDTWVKNAFIETHEYINEIVQKYKFTDGTAANVVLITPHKIYCANCGDSRSILVRKDSFVPLSIDHKPGAAKEFKRIRENYGYIDKNGRLNGEVALARALGDLKCHPALTHIPELDSQNRTTNDLAIVMACDGIWDVFDNNTVSRMTRERLGLSRVADVACFLRDAAHFNDSGDNISCMVIRL